MTTNYVWPGVWIETRMPTRTERNAIENRLGDTLKDARAYHASARKAYDECDPESCEADDLWDKLSDAENRLEQAEEDMSDFYHGGE